ncbi:CAMK family protein kinase [Tritrichomonas foetus]|uniref:CAMK family protein kinase n=1 Tax=Tritrichomonas foetus TaxID=1144522 RepID=A0A1J4KQ58_9EUKA|nr:CAMK family protein kinase [Tritrichomonas foetus]|eukprot:OHT11565.1 CAMK family protein kinase [Tritrichomonas foetus]
MTEIKTGTVIRGYKFLEKIGHGGYSDVYKVINERFDMYFVAKVLKFTPQFPLEEHQNGCSKNVTQSAEDLDPINIYSIYDQNQSNINGTTCESSQSANSLLSLQNHSREFDRAWKSFDAEVNALLKLDHPHIIRLYDHFRDTSNFYLILEYCPNGSLMDLIQKDKKVTGKRLFEISKQLLNALSYIHMMGISHCDVKPQNVLFDEFGRVKLADFGIATFEMRVKNHKCSYAYAPPEVLKGISEYDTLKSDVWSTGITLIYASTGKMPFQCDTFEQLYSNVESENITISSDMPHELLMIAKSMITYDPLHRITMKEAENRLNEMATVTLPPLKGLERGHYSNMLLCEAKKSKSLYKTPFLTRRMILNSKPSVNKSSSLRMNVNL